MSLRYSFQPNLFYNSVSCNKWWSPGANFMYFGNHLKMWLWIQMRRQKKSKHQAQTTSTHTDQLLGHRMFRIQPGETEKHTPCCLARAQAHKIKTELSMIKDAIKNLTLGNSRKDTSSFSKQFCLSFCLELAASTAQLIFCLILTGWDKGNKQFTSIHECRD